MLLQAPAAKKQDFLVGTTHYQGVNRPHLNTCLQRIYREWIWARFVCSSMAERMLRAAASARRPSSRATTGFSRWRTACRNDFSSARNGSSDSTFGLFSATPGIGRVEGVSANDMRLCKENFSSWVTRIWKTSWRP